MPTRPGFGIMFRVFLISLMNGVMILMQKKALLALMLALTLCLSGCALIVKDEAVDAATVILTYGDKTITKAEVQKAANEQLSSTAYMYQLYGYSYDTTDPENISAAQEAAVENLKTEMVQEAKIKELGLTLTEETKQLSRKAPSQTMTTRSTI